MMNRRNLLMTSAAAAAASAGGVATSAEAKEAVRESFARTMDPRGRDGIYVRMPKLDMESKGDFLAGLYVWRQNQLEAAADVRAIQVLKAAGVDPNADIPWEQAVALLEKDPILLMTCRARSSHQKLKYAMLQREYHAMADQFLSEMERADKMGPGALELNPRMTVPEYTAHEIHSMPGGYVGDPFAGHMYHGGTDWGAYVDKNYQDGAHMAMAAAVPLPEDRKVRRVLDLGTSIGQFATSMKRRFPEAEVWGIDIGGPMVRYAHLKALDMGVNVNFAQRLAEDTKFPSNHFDLVTSNLLFHEVTTQAAKDIIKETYRVLRTGGVFSPTDVNRRPKSAHDKFTLWYNYRWNHEDWYMDWEAVDFGPELRKAGFKVIEKAPGTQGPRFTAIKV
jgi:2-polyprenyl-3-methyl-5-hydroxy-6-metoxy-1,4-benzoquinol methylase